MNSKKYDGCLYDTVNIETLKDIITNSVELHPDFDAFMYKDVHGEPFKSITYREFKDMIDALGTALIDMGFKGSNIAVSGANSYRWVLSYMTTVCGVGVIVPIDKNLKHDERLNLLTRADVELVFASSDMLEDIEDALAIELVKKVVITDGADKIADFIASHENVMTQDELIAKGRELVATGNREYIDAVVDKEDLAAILFTSGTTGLAKGAMLSHKNLASNVQNVSKYFHVDPGKKVLSVLPMHHAFEMTASILTGLYQYATIVVCEGLKHIQTNFLEAQCNVMLGVPLVFETIYKRIWQVAEKTGQAATLRRGLAISKKLDFRNHPKITDKVFKSVKSMFSDDFYSFVVGGAAMDPSIIADIEAMGLPMIQGYGMTECAPIISVNTDRYGKVDSVGRPIPGTEVCIIDKDEAGIGEIICKSSSVMIGYYKDPENTEKVLKDGWLYTGDYGYLDEDGFLYITGRKKNVIVTKGGKNIFPEEIEYYLLLNEFVNETIVYGKYDEAKDDLVTTAIILPDFEALKAAGCNDSMEDYYKKLKEVVEEVNDKVPAYKRVKRLEVRDRDFVKTSTLKIKRFEEDNYVGNYEGQ